jgi:hypothetical protein
VHWVLIDAPGSFRGFVDLTKVKEAELTEAGELILRYEDGTVRPLPAKEAGAIIMRLRDFATLAEATKPPQLSKRHA